MRNDDHPVTGHAGIKLQHIHTDFHSLREGWQGVFWHQAACAAMALNFYGGGATRE